MKKLTNIEFLREVKNNNSYYETFFTVEEDYKSNRHKILIKTPYGNCRVKSENLYRKNIKPSILSAIDRNEYFKEMVREMHPFNLDKCDYKDSVTKVIVICSIHGEFSIIPNSLLSGRGCKSCGTETVKKKLTISRGELLKKFHNIHGNRYKYDFCNSEKTTDKINIICNIHGTFNQTSHSHMSGQGCPKCGVEKNQLKPHVWDCKNWKKAAEMSKSFDSFKLYIIRLYNETEDFYKVGRTFNTLSKRVYKIPYKFDKIKVIEGEPCYITELEKTIKNDNKHNLYTPKITFGGQYECFIKLNYEL